MSEMNEEQLIKTVADAATFKQPLMIIHSPDGKSGELLTNQMPVEMSMALLTTAIILTAKKHGMSTKKLLKTLTAGVKSLGGKI